MAEIIKIQDGSTDVLPVGAESGDYVSNNGGYCKQPDGTLIQWGSVTIMKNSWTQTVPLAIPFSNVNLLSIQATALDNDIKINVNWSDVSVSKISIGRSPNTSSNTIYWLAIGRWK